MTVDRRVAAEPAVAPVTAVSVSRRGAHDPTTLVRAARGVGSGRLWLVTTNDNVRDLRFYQRYGFDLVAVHRDAVARSRALKPTIPRLGMDGIPIRHELELELRLSSGGPDGGR
ncbi:GNAT family N-acetyltransferase [Streptomyces incarnatus]|uniref:GNAT family N-acetyltransferase n=1 Tax=Streptomyces incarnatus TaxID=665007 RepID=UPI000AD6CDDE|nr:GNAT family N-acetyltransferase [Streptomyces incarnatus]